MRTIPRLTWMIVLVMVFALLACRPPWIPPHDTTPSDTSAKQLDMLVNVHVYVDSHSVPQKLNVIASITYQKVNVQFQHGENIACDGVVLDSEIGADIPLPKDDAPVVCTYHQGTSQTEFSFVPPHNLIVSSPQPNAKLPRSFTTTITYAPDTGRDVIDVNINCADANYVHQTEQQLNRNAASNQCDSSAFTAGEGIIHLDRDYELHPRVGFHSLDLILTVEAQIPVQWT